jgi:hypothetical protein
MTKLPKQVKREAAAQRRIRQRQRRITSEEALAQVERVQRESAARPTASKIVIEPKPKRKQWKKSSRYRAALKRATGHNWLRLHRLGNGSNPFYELPQGVLHEMMLQESHRMGDELFLRYANRSPWAGVIAQFEFPTTSEQRTSIWARLKKWFAKRV